MSPAETTTPLPESPTGNTPKICIQDKSNSQLSIKSSSKICRENLSTLGYESCKLLLKLTMTNSCNSSNPIKVVCTASTLTTDSLNYQTIYELTNTHLVSSSATKTTVLLEWFPTVKSTAIQSIELSNGQCNINF